MHLQDGPQLDLSAQVAKVKEKARPWKPIIALTLAILAAATSGWAHHDFAHFFASSHLISQVVAAGAAAAFCVLGCVAAYAVSGQTRTVLAKRAGTSAPLVAVITLTRALAVRRRGPADPVSAGGAAGSRPARRRPVRVSPASLSSLAPFSPL
jgi:dihydrodipicolinate synthase/N-acetylneuraminate lyase